MSIVFCDKGRTGFTIFLVYLGLDIEIDAGNDQVGDDVASAHQVQNIGIIERDAFRYLHKRPETLLVTMAPA